MSKLNQQPADFSRLQFWAQTIADEFEGLSRNVRRTLQIGILVFAALLVLFIVTAPLDFYELKSKLVYGRSRR